MLRARILISMYFLSGQDYSHPMRKCQNKVFCQNWKYLNTNVSKLENVRTGKCQS